jgi:hypothetical protein
MNACTAQNTKAATGSSQRSPPCGKVTAATFLAFFFNRIFDQILANRVTHCLNEIFPFDGTPQGVVDQRPAMTPADRPGIDTHARLEAAAAEDADGTEPWSGSFALQEDKLDSALRS